MLLADLVIPQSLAADVLRSITRAISPVFAIGVIITGFYAVKNVKSIEYSGLGRLVFIMVGLGVYVHLASAVETTISSIVGAVNGNDSIATRISTLSDIVMTQTSSVSVFPSLYDWLREFVVDVLCQFIVQIMKRFQQFLLLFLYVTGPIALVLSSIPDFKGLFMSWFRNYLAIQFWSLTFVVLDKILLIVTASKMMNNGTFGSTPEEVISNNSAMATLDLIIIIVSYLFVSTLTTYYIGRNEGGGLTRQVVQTVSQIAMAAKSFGTSTVAKSAASFGGASSKGASQVATSAGGGGGGAQNPGYSVPKNGTPVTSTTTSQQAQQTFNQPKYKLTT